MESHGEGEEFGDLGVHHEQVGQAELRRVGRRRRRNSKMKRKKGGKGKWCKAHFANKGKFNGNMGGPKRGAKHKIKKKVGQ